MKQGYTNCPEEKINQREALTKFNKLNFLAC